MSNKKRDEKPMFRTLDEQDSEAVTGGLSLASTSIQSLSVKTVTGSLGRLAVCSSCHSCAAFDFGGSQIR